MGPFARIARDARAWLQAPLGGEKALAAIEAHARDVSALVPQERRTDWEKLVAGFAGTERADKRRARVEGLVRACRLFDRGERDRARLARPLAWADPVDRADGVGRAVRERLAAHGIRAIADLVWTLPVAWDDLREPVSVREAIERARAWEAALAPASRQCVAAVVKSATIVPMRGRRAVRVVLAAREGEGSKGGDGTIDAWWFFAAHGVLSIARPGAACIAVGRVRVREGGKRACTMAHPDLVIDEAAARAIRARHAVSGVAPATLRRAIADAVLRTSPLPDPVPPDVAARESMRPVHPLLGAVHGVGSPHPGPPPVSGKTEEPHEARRALAERLAWVEAFTRVWQRLLAESAWGDARAPVVPRDDRLLARLVDALGFEPTASQRRAIDAVARDLDSPVPMRRLLLGDVGTGKTAVALAAAALCVAAGAQCALLVPTSVLAEQYVDAAAPVERAAGTRVVRIVSGTRAVDRRAALASIASGEAGVVVGTHALLEEDVVFARLGLVVVDEQQRLGVAQRLSLVRKGTTTRPHLLSLSATPIPRTMALALRGELATTVLDERPRGRSTPATEMRSRARTGEIVGDVRACCERGERAFWVCPRIEDDDEEEEEIGVVARVEWLAREVGRDRVALVHGAMPAAERARAMRAMRRGEAQVLVGTTVVEVGIDVPEATLVVVDGADRFGLAQLHQIRGRVGRGARPGRCILVHDEPLAAPARCRLETLVRTSDGTEIARADLVLRGAGDLGGTRQSGLVEDFAWLDPNDPPAWIDRIEADARALLARDPRLESPEHLALALAVRRFATQLAVREEAG